MAGWQGNPQGYTGSRARLGRGDVLAYRGGQAQLDRRVLSSQRADEAGAIARERVDIARQRVRIARRPRRLACNFDLCRGLVVSFQEVVHSALTEEAEVAEASDSEGRTEWTPIRMRL